MARGSAKITRLKSVSTSEFHFEVSDVSSSEWVSVRYDDGYILISPLDQLVSNYKVIPDESGRFTIPVIFEKTSGPLKGYQFIATVDGILVDLEIEPDLIVISSDKNLYHGFNSENEDMCRVGNHTLYIKSEIGDTTLFSHFVVRVVEDGTNRVLFRFDGRKKYQSTV